MEADVKNINRGKGMPNVRTPMVALMSCLDAQGFTEEFMMVDEGLKGVKTNQVFQPEDLEIVEFHRFEGISDPDDMAILFIVKTKSGVKGTIVDAFGVYGNSDLMDFMNKVKEDPNYKKAGEPIHKCDVHLTEKNGY